MESTNMCHEINNKRKQRKTITISKILNLIYKYIREISLINYEVKNTACFFFIVSENNSPTLEKHATHSLNIAPFHFSN